MTKGSIKSQPVTVIKVLKCRQFVILSNQAQEMHMYDLMSV